MAPSLSQEPDTKAMKCKGRLLLDSALHEFIIERENHRGHWMTDDVLLVHLNGRYDFEGNRTSVPDFRINTTMLNAAIKQCFPGCGIIQEGRLVHGLFLLDKRILCKRYVLYFVCKPGQQVELTYPKPRDTDEWVVFIDRANNPTNSILGRISSRAIAKRQRIQSDVDLQIEMAQKQVATMKQSDLQNGNKLVRPVSLYEFQSVFDDPLVRRIFGAKENEDVEDTLRRRMSLFTECINVPNGYKNILPCPMDPNDEYTEYQKKCITRRCIFLYTAYGFALEKLPHRRFIEEHPELFIEQNQEATVDNQQPAAVVDEENEQENATRDDAAVEHESNDGNADEQ